MWRKSSLQLGGNRVPPLQESRWGITYFERILSRLGMANDFWGKQAVLQGSVLLGCVGLYTAAGIAAAKGHAAQADVLARIPIGVGISALWAIDKVVKREDIRDATACRRKTIMNCSFMRTLTSSALAIGIVLSAGQVLPALVKITDKAIYGEKTMTQDLQRLDHWLKQ